MSSYEYEVVCTADGSPSIRMGSPEQPSEVMHHSGGALTESLFIYSAAVARAIEQNWPPRVISVGLGLGYNEAITLANFIRADRADHANRLQNLDLVSFEIDPLLREEYTAWLLDRPRPSHMTIDFKALYDDILERIGRQFEIEPQTLKKALADAFQSGRYQLFAALEKRPPLGQRYSCILFDAFSKKATPGLWQEDFLKQFLEDAAASNCVLATYAATGNLNRALRATGFRLIPRTGFQGKRESTWAERP